MHTWPSDVKSISSRGEASFLSESALEVERTVWRLRWAALVGGPILAWFADLVVVPWLLLCVVAVGGLVNMVLGYLLRSPRRSPPQLGYAMALLDVALISLGVAALEGSVNRYAHVYLLSVATAAMRFGFVGTLVATAVAWSGLASVFWLTRGAPDDLRSQVIYPTLLLLLAGLLLGQFAQQVKKWLGEGLQRQQYLERRLTELAVLQEINNTVYNLKSGDTLQNIVEVCTKVLGFRRAALFLRTVQEGMPDQYFSSRHQGRSDQPQELSPLHFDRRLFESMLKADRAFVVDGSQGSDIMAYGPMLEIAAPLHTPTGPIGVLVVDCGDRPKVSDTEIEVLSGLANSATLAIENAQVHSLAQWRANHDGLTDLYNHGYFQEALRQEVTQSDAEGGSLALLMIELDSFKRYNDTYGHRQGDRALVSLARSLEACVERWLGTVARYGGDEFAVILPGLGRPGALQAAHEVGNWVRELTATDLSRHGLPGITVSVGGAVYPADAKDAGQLIEAADRAMYVAKRRGGDQVEAFSRIGASSPFSDRPLATPRGREGERGQGREQEGKR